LRSDRVNISLPVARSGGGIFNKPSIGQCLGLRHVGPGRLVMPPLQFVVRAAFLFLLTLALGKSVLVLVAGDGRLLFSNGEQAGDVRRPQAVPVALSVPRE